MCTKRLQALSRERPLHVRLRRLVIREVLLVARLTAWVILGWIVAAYTACVFHALTGG